MNIVYIVYNALTEAVLAESASARELGENSVKQIISRLDEEGLLTGSGTIRYSKFDISYFDGWKRYAYDSDAMYEYGVDYEVMKREFMERLAADGEEVIDEEGIELSVADACYSFFQARCWEVEGSEGSTLIKGKKDLTESLHEAVELGYPSLVKRVLADGADVNARVASFTHETALLTAVRRGYVECLKLLIDAGADITGDKGKEALACATRYDQVACKNILRDAGAGRKVRSKKQSKTAE